MPLQGFLEAVERFQVRGWAFDPDQPDSELQVEILLHGQPVGSSTANLFRPDLQQGGIGGGHHCFVFNFTEPLSEDALQHVTARVAGAGDAGLLTRWGEAQAWHAAGHEQSAPQISFPGMRQDETATPLFILGAACSGTTAVAQALLKSTRYQGYYEGHLLDLLAEYYVMLDRFYAYKGDEWTNPTRSTTIRQVPIEFCRAGFESVVITAMQAVFPHGRWLDKTPTPNMIHVAGQLRQIWPQAKFIYLKRRAFENLVSRSRKFLERSFEVDCREWAGAMQAWRQVRPSLAGCALQIDQLHLAQSPGEAASAIAAFLQLEADEGYHLQQALAVDRPERAGDVFSQVYDPAGLGWSNEQWRAFNEICGPEVDAFGYSRTQSYFAGDDPALLVERI